MICHSKSPAFDFHGHIIRPNSVSPIQPSSLRWTRTANCIYSATSTTTKLSFEIERWDLLFCELDRMEEQRIGIFKSEDGEAEVSVRFDADTCWLSLNEISVLYARCKYLISRHIRNVFQSGELNRASTVAKNATVQTEGGRSIRRVSKFKTWRSSYQWAIG